jgi:hypothetical protein
MVDRQVMQAGHISELLIVKEMDAEREASKQKVPQYVKSLKSQRQ